MPFLDEDYDRFVLGDPGDPFFGNGLLVIAILGTIIYWWLA